MDISIGNDGQPVNDDPDTSAAVIELPAVEYVEHMLAGTLKPEHRTHMRCPTAISETLAFHIGSIGDGVATLFADVNVDIHGNQQGTVHGGFLTELADATIGTACSTLINPGESFASVNLSATFIRPVWGGQLIAEAYPTHIGNTLSHWYCEIIRTTDQKTVMTATSTMMLLRGEQAVGR
jgi:uncharacterized protein (TIGR00369 family)